MATFKELSWSPPLKPCDECRYDHVEAVTPFGLLRIEWKSWKSYDTMDITFNGEWVASGPCAGPSSPTTELHETYRAIEQAKATAYEWFLAKLQGCLPSEVERVPAHTELQGIFDSNKGADGTLVISKALAESLLEDWAYRNERKGHYPTS